MKLGHAVNAFITAIFLIYFLFILIAAKKPWLLRFLDLWFSICNPYDAALDGQNPSILMLGQGFNFLILLCHMMISLFVARESVLIHMDEVEKKSIS